MSSAETYLFDDDGRFPNSALPLLVYRAAMPADAGHIEEAFRAHGWSNGWRNGIFGYHHFHSNAHEVLGIATGRARVAFGGPSGRQISVRAGDVVVIPAGVAHRAMGRSIDLLVVGAYPDGTECDLRRGDPMEHAAAIQAVMRVPVPVNDPVFGREGWLLRHWKQSA